MTVFIDPEIGLDQTEDDGSGSTAAGVFGTMDVVQRRRQVVHRDVVLVADDGG